MSSTFALSHSLIPRNTSLALTHHLLWELLSSPPDLLSRSTLSHIQYLLVVLITALSQFLLSPAVAGSCPTVAVSFAVVSMSRAPSVCSTQSACSADTGCTIHGCDVRAAVSTSAEAESPPPPPSAAARPAAPFTLPPGIPPMPAYPVPIPVEEAAPADAGRLAEAAVADAGHRALRQVHEEFRNRDDVGTFGVYQGNWGGNRQNARLHNHVRTDVALNAPTHIVTAQEVDPDFARSMRTAKEEGSNQLMWHLAVLEEDEHKTCMIAARRSWAESVLVLERHVTNDGEYGTRGRGAKKDKRKSTARSRVLVAEIVLICPAFGRKTVKVATCHVHHMTAKKASGFSKAYTDWWAGVQHVLRRRKVEILTGDFNMGLWEVVKKIGVTGQMVLVSCFLWRCGQGGAIPEGDEDSDDDDAPADAGTASAAAPADAGSASAAAPLPVRGRPPVPQDLRSDSCGIFLLTPVLDVKWACSSESLWPADYNKLPMFPRGSGFPLQSYLGKEDAFFHTWEVTHNNVARTRGFGVPVDIRLEPWPFVKNKQAIFTKFDPDGVLFRSGAHAPQLAWFGTRSRRSTEALWERERKQTIRGWGPGSENRARLMQEQGRGPPPGQRCEDSRGQDGLSCRGGGWPGDVGGRICHGEHGKGRKGDGVRGDRGKQGGQGGWIRGGEHGQGGKGEGIRGGGGSQGGLGGWIRHAEHGQGSQEQGIRGGGVGTGDGWSDWAASATRAWGSSWW